MDNTQKQKNKITGDITPLLEEKLKDKNWAHDKNNADLSWDEFQKEVACRMKDFVLIKLCKSHLKLAKKCYRIGHSVSDTVSFLILK